MSRLKNRLEMAANVAIVVAAVGSIGGWLVYFSTTGPNQPLRAQYVVGDSLENVPEIAALEKKPTLVLLVFSGCSICTDSMPFYRNLVDEHKRSKPNMNLIFASREPRPALDEYLESHGIGDSSTLHIPYDSDFKQTLVPSLFFLNEERQIVRAWVGKLGQDEEAAVISQVATVE